jgi:hypothetical protein
VLLPLLLPLLPLSSLLLSSPELSSPVLSSLDVASSPLDDVLSSAVLLSSLLSVLSVLSLRTVGLWLAL